MYQKLCIFFVILGLAGCSSTGSNNSRYSMKHDKAPDRPVDVSHVKDAVPRVEPKSRGGNKSPYTVLGKQYYIMPSALGYVATGTASWYGRKFHGHLTSNGETYDMYGMSAAHKSLPLPTFLKVTNLANNKQVIVRVNDRGPFHGDRLIDLSYAAASKLDMLKHGTARVRIEAIDPQAWQRSSNVIAAAPVAEPSVAGKYLQVGAYSNRNSAQYVEEQLRMVFADLAVIIRTAENAEGVALHRVQLGPLQPSTSLAEVTKQLELLGYSNPRLIDYP
jgi:rare lipoprotein A